MITKNKIAIAVASVLGAIAPMVAFAAGDLQLPSEAVTLATGAVTNLGTIINSSLPTILLVASALLGVAVLWRWLRRTVK